MIMKVLKCHLCKRKSLVQYGNSLMDIPLRGLHYHLIIITSSKMLKLLILLSSNALGYRETLDMVY